MQTIKLDCDTFNHFRQKNSIAVQHEIDCAKIPRACILRHSGQQTGGVTFLVS